MYFGKGNQKDTMALHYVKMSSEAYAPTRATSQAAGLDLRAAKEETIEPQERKPISTQLKIMIPENHYGRIAPRSGLSLHQYIDVCAGVIDADYRGEIKILLHNHGTKPFKVLKGDKIAQLICERISIPSLIEVEDLPPTVRGIAGFGSTGTR